MTQDLKNKILHCLRHPNTVDPEYRYKVIDAVRELPVDAVKNNKDVENDLKSRIIQA